MNSIKYNENALDLIRLIAAIQVAFTHTAEMLQLGMVDSWWFPILHFFPGVPIFFFVSGYLISRSYERSPNLFSYGKNRFLRIFPALWVCVVFNILLVATTGYFYINNVSLIDILILGGAKSSFLQFYNPDYMRQFGDGVLNGSLWTITVELQFYFIVPFLYKLLIDRFQQTNLLILVLVAIFVFANRMLYFLQPEFGEEVIWKLYRVSFIPWFYMFLVGVFVQRNFDGISEFINRVPFPLYLLLYSVVVYLIYDDAWVVGNDVHPLFFLLIAILVFKLSYTQSALTCSKLLQGNDLSYGIYIFHMPILNQFMYLDYKTGTVEVLLLFSLYVVIACASWLMIEKPALKLKRFSLKYSK